MNKEVFNERAQSFLDKAQNILNQADAEGRELTPAERGQVDEFTQSAESNLTKAKWHAQAEIDMPAIHAKKVAQSQGRSIDQVPAKVRTASTTLFPSVKEAYDVGQWIRARFLGHEDAATYCHRHGLIKASMLTGDNPSGGFLVPEPLENTVIELREQFGVFRRNAANVTLGNGRLTIPRVAGEITAYYVGEGAEITPSDPLLNSITLDAKKIAVLTTMSSELDEDSVVSVAEMLARSIAYSFAVAEDTAGFNGTGLSATGGIVGLQGALEVGSRYTATGRTTFGALTMADFEAVAGQAKMFGPNRKFYISNTGYFNSMQRLMDAVGGTSMTEIANGRSTMSFLGFPVEITQVLESRTSGTTGATACYFGDLSAGAFIGTRRGISIRLDSSRYFSSDMLALRATQRYDIVVHDIGTASVSGGLVRMIFG